MIRNATPAEASGPTSWLPIFRDAEQLVRGDLWPAVAAVAEELSWSTSGLLQEDVATLATSALDEPPNDITSGSSHRSGQVCGKQIP
jgi:hypothetical protein